MEPSIQIRLARYGDVEGMLAIYGPFIENTSVSFEAEVPSIDSFWGRVEKVLAQAPWLVCTVDGQVAGYAYAAAHRERAAYRYTRELSVYVGEVFYGMGIATTLYSVLIDILKMQGFANTLIGITLPNPASVRFHEKMGYRPVGVYHRIGFKHGVYHDVGWWEMPIREEAPGDLVFLGDLDKNSLEAIFREAAERVRNGRGHDYGH